MKYTMYLFLNYDVLKSEYFDMYQNVIQDMSSVKIIKNRWVSAKPWTYYMYVLEVDNRSVAEFIYRMNNSYEIIVTDADRLTNVTNDLCRRAVEEELSQNKRTDLDKALSQMAGAHIVTKSDEEILSDFLNTVSEANYERIAQEIEFSYKEDHNDKTMKLGSYGSIRYVFLAQPISEKPTLFIRDFEKKIGKTITSDGVVQEYTF